MTIKQEKKYAICPVCGLTVHSVEETKKGEELTCMECDTTWVSKFTYGYNDRIVSIKELNNKEKKEQKEKLIVKYEELKSQIREINEIEDIREKHYAMDTMDKEFAILCPNKAKAYWDMDEFRNELLNDNYEIYMNGRLRKMIRDIDKILFYFGK